MLKKTFLTCIVCIAVYSAFISFVAHRSKDFNGAQNMWQENTIRLQDYIYSKKSYDNIIIGSSLSTHILVDENESKKTFSLAAGGGDSFVGLEIIKRNNKMPQRILVESNFLLTKKVHDQTYLGSLYLPGFYQLRKVMPVFKERYPPASFLGSAFMFVIKKITHEDEKAAPNKQSGNSKDSVDYGLKERMAQNKYDSKNFIKDKVTIESNLKILQNYIDYFKKNGVDIYFFEMPRDCTIANNQLSVYSRERVDEIIKKNNITEIPLPPCQDYNTSDGLHLTESSTVKYTQFFFDQLKKSTNSKANH